MVKVIYEIGKCEVYEKIYAHWLRFSFFKPPKLLGIANKKLCFYDIVTEIAERILREVATIWIEQNKGKPEEGNLKIFVKNYKLFVRNYINDYIENHHKEINEEIKEKLQKGNFIYIYGYEKPHSPLRIISIILHELIHIKFDWFWKLFNQYFHEWEIHLSRRLFDKQNHYKIVRDLNLIVNHRSKQKFRRFQWKSRAKFKA